MDGKRVLAHGGFGQLLRRWRVQRRLSQLDLAVEAEISTRHLSFIETGRAQPSREMVLLLARALDVPLRDRNDLLTAAGYAAVYRESSLAAPAMAQVRRALDFILRQQEPYPALVLDRHWNVLRVNEGSARVQAIFDDVDVVITPGTAMGPSRIGAYQRRGAISTLTLVTVRVPFQAVFNVTGQPAAVVPWDLDGNGVPTSIQLVGKPFDEATLLSLGAQIEQARPWVQRRPPVS